MSETITIRQKTKDGERLMYMSADPTVHNKKQPTPINGYIIVEFHYDHSQSVVQQDNGLFVPERYVIESGDEDADAAWGVTTDRKAINPQIVDILSGEYTGKRAFVHYGAFEVAKWLSQDRVADGRAVIPEKMIFFFVDPIECMPGNYLGEEVFGEYERTDSGIILSTSLELKEAVLIEITHVPKYVNGLIMVGRTVVTVDAFQYDLVYAGKKYIKVDEREIVGIKVQPTIPKEASPWPFNDVTPEELGFRPIVPYYLPIGDVVLVDYLPDPEWEEWKINNEDRREEYVDKYYPHLDKTVARGLYPKNLETPEPKFTTAKIVAIGDKVKPGEFVIGDRIMVYRNHGCRLPNSQWILSMDVIIGVING